ncbi:hypothetical protein QLX08_005720 [Tetragonisca angustula]|uniref:RRM domain-containing protein n=1 Tax=Tetragonisca angustula TaxID=166442 RepID=A0AAW0ZZ69_9HYME
MSSASTGGTEGSSPASSPASATSLTMAAPKYGTLVPNRIFVGGISANTSVEELAQLFSSYGNVKATKIIADRAGVSKGYGFVTFETEEEAKRLQQESECIVLRERKLNIAPAIKKQPFNRSLDGGSGSPPSVPTSTYYYPNGMGLTYQNGMTFYNTTAPTPTTPIAPPTDPATIYQATGVFGPQAAGHQTFAPVMYPCPAPSIYMPQQYQYSPMPYECYTGAVATGAHQYLYSTNNSQTNTNSGNSNSGTGNNGTGATSPPTGPPPPLPSLPPPSLPPPPPTHFYPPAAPPPHHHPPVPASPAPQMDHIYYPFAAGPHPPLPPHASMGLTDQQLLLFPTDASCQQTSSSDGQVVPQEDSRSTSSHSEQAHGETQVASGSTTPLVSLMPVKFPMSGRYTNYHPIAIHTANVYSSQTCLNETDDCSGNQMHCRAIVYHPAAVYIPHTHTPPFHNTSGGTSLLPTPPSVSHQLFDSSKSQCFNSRDYTKSGNMNSQNNYSKSQNHGIMLSHQNPFFRAQNVGNSQPYKHSNIDGNYKYTTPAMSSRFSMQYNKKATGSNVGSPACFVAQKLSENYNSAQKSFGSNTIGSQSYNCTNTQKTFNPTANFDYANDRKINSSSDQYFENATKSNNYSSRKNTTNYRKNGVIIGSSDQGDNNSNSQSNDKYVTNIKNENSSSQNVQGTENSNSEKPVSPPPAPYSPMTRPLPTLSPPTSQVQFYNPAQNRYQPSLAPSQHQQQQQPQQPNAQRRYTIAPALSASRKPLEKYANSGSQTTTTTMLRQNKYKVNGIMQTGNKVADDSLGGAGDAPPGVGRMPITPPGTPRTHSGHPAGDQNQLSDTCHQMQALSL